MTIRARLSSLTTGALLAATLIATTAAPTRAAPATSDLPAAATESEQTASQTAGAVAWYSTTSLGGPIRACFKASCDWYYKTSPGDDLLWSHNAYNEYGNLWYYVDNGFTRGWIHCGNVTAGC
ncbi:hypothetical protein ACWZEH_10160 [Streptomyces sp. QTS137]